MKPTKDENDTKNCTQTKQKKPISLTETETTCKCRRRAQNKTTFCASSTEEILGKREGNETNKQNKKRYRERERQVSIIYINMCL